MGGRYSRHRSNKMLDTSQSKLDLEKVVSDVDWWKSRFDIGYDELKGVEPDFFRVKELGIVRKKPRESVTNDKEVRNEDYSRASMNRRSKSISIFKVKPAKRDSFNELSKPAEMQELPFDTKQSSRQHTEAAEPIRSYNMVV